MGVVQRTTVDKRYGLLALKLQGGIKPFYYVFGGGIFMEISILILNGEGIAQKSMVFNQRTTSP